MPLPRTAYIDESLRVRDGLYILAAVIVADADANHHRQALTGLLYRGQTRLHWRNESSRRRVDLVGAVSRLPHTGAIIIGTGMASGRQERARRKCIEQLLHELISRSIASIVFERRHAELDARDRALITALRRRHALPGSLQATWLAAADEPLLWLPDIVAGAASLAETGDGTYWEPWRQRSGLSGSGSRDA
jgi:hypothetical protein